ncbi:hypothetical protein Heshes_17440 [Alicyclobacillus hesperidum]|uniref:Lysophospholipase L1 n=1 Tax=Alicyclobacillus hesperidum TaxID=89784 RepID=A0A1H2U3P0_9BACL|nr:SGNH/GDSL hydrolase family protein [Alicyclobacillus hesperidum]GLV14060.1 hypothetical protein Heshes_17440 [Alicyclobacillus hesperidum]SDW50597.1 Lysophospholipase L1 [Alicyclobacillus hesperidum]
MARDIYLAIGDTVTAGQGASHPRLGFVQHVGNYLRDQSFAQRTIIMALPGLTAKRLFQLVSTPRLNLWDDVNVITVCFGSADLLRLLRPAVRGAHAHARPPRSVLKHADEFGYHTDQLFRLIREKQVPHVLVTTLYNPLPGFAPAREFVEGMNGIICDCASYYKFPVVDLEKGFANNEAYLIDGYRTGSVLDLMHPLRKPILPNNAGHKLIAHLITQRLSQLLTKKKQGQKSGTSRPGKLRRRLTT